MALHQPFTMLCRDDRRAQAARACGGQGPALHGAVGAFLLGPLKRCVLHCSYTRFGRAMAPAIGPEQPSYLPSRQYGMKLDAQYGTCTQKTPVAGRQREAGQGREGWRLGSTPSSSSSPSSSSRATFEGPSVWAAVNFAHRRLAHPYGPAALHRSPAPITSQRRASGRLLTPRTTGHPSLCRLHPEARHLAPRPGVPPSFSTRLRPCHTGTHPPAIHPSRPPRDD